MMKTKQLTEYKRYAFTRENVADDRNRNWNSLSSMGLSKFFFSEYVCENLALFCLSFRQTVHE